MIHALDFLPWKRHERWHRAVSASIDGELDPGETDNLRGHLAGCAECQAYERELRSMRNALSSMRDVQAPRSFRLTPAMVTARAAPPARGTGGMVMRGAQLATALAVVALAVVSVVDFSDSGTKRAATSTASLADAAGNSEKSAPLAAPAGGSGFGSVPQDTHAPQPEATAVSGTPAGGVAIPTPRGPNSAGAGCDGAQPLNPDAPATAPGQPTPCPSTTPDTPQASRAAGPPPAAEAPNSNEAAPPVQRVQTATGEPAIAPATAAATTAKAGWYRPAEVGLGVVAAVAALAVIGLSLRTRRP